MGSFEPFPTASLDAGTSGISPVINDQWLPLSHFRPKRFHPGKIGNWSGHLPFAHDLVAALRPRLLVELGTHYGESYFGLCQSVLENSVDCQCYAIDSWIGEPQTGYYGEEVYREVLEYNQTHYADFSYLIRSTFDAARPNFSNDSVSLLHIDGLHTYEAVKHDFEVWFSTIEPGGIVLFHDVAAKHSDFGVSRFWDELKKLGANFTFRHSWGLGVFQKSGHGFENELLNTIFNGSEREKAHLRRFYELRSKELTLESTFPSNYGTSSSRFSLEIFPGTASGFRADCVVKTVAQAGEWVHLALDLINGSSTGQFRIDVTEQPCLFDISGIRITTAATNRVILQADGREQLATHLAPAESVRLLPEWSDQAFCRFLSTSNDPQLLLTLPLAEADQPVQFEIWLRVHLSFDVLDSLITAVTNTISASQLHAINLADRSSAVSTDPVIDPDELLHLQSAIPEMTRQVELLISDIEVLKHESDQVAGENHRLSQEVDHLRRALTLSLEREANQIASVKNTEQTLADLTLQKLDLERLIADSNQRFSILDRKMKSVVSSRSWQVTQPLRALMKVIRMNKNSS